MNNEFYEYICPICNEKMISGLAYFACQEPNKYQREMLEEHLIDNHSEQIVSEYLIEKLKDRAAKEIVKKIREQNKLKEKQYKQSKRNSFFNRILRI